MYSNEEIVAVLQAVYIEHKTKTQTAADYQMHWNTVYNICKKYKTGDYVQIPLDHV